MAAAPLLLASALLLLGAPLAVADVPTCEDERDGCWCGPYTWIVGDEEEGVGMTEHGSVQVAAASTLGWYVFVDSPLSIVRAGGLFSVWLYPEANGERGAQRGDHTCDDCDDGARCDPDVILP